MRFPARSRQTWLVRCRSSSSCAATSTTRTRPARCCKAGAAISSSGSFVPTSTSPPRSTRLRRRARASSQVSGSGILLLGLFLAFAITLGRLLRARRKHALTEERLRQAHKMEAVGQLAGGIAHDFNNLLTTIIGYAALLSARVADDEVAVATPGEIEQASAHAAHLTEQLLAFSRTQALRPRTINLNTVVTETRTILDRLIAADVEVDVELAADLPYVHADPTQITGVLMNLHERAGRDAQRRAHVGRDAHGRSRREDRRPARRPRRPLRDALGDGQRIRHRRDDPRTHLRALLHDQAARDGNRPRALPAPTEPCNRASGFIVVEKPDEAGARFSVYLPGVRRRPSAQPRMSTTIATPPRRSSSSRTSPRCGSSSRRSSAAPAAA